MDPSQWYYPYRVFWLFLQACWGMLLFAWPLPRRRRLLLRCVLSLAGGLLVVGVLYQCCIPTGLLPYRAINLAAYLLVAVVVYACWDVSPWTALLVGSNGYLAQHMAGSVKTLLLMRPAAAVWAQHMAGMLAIDLLCYGTTYGILLLTLRPKRRHTALMDRPTEFSFSALILWLCIGMSQLTKGVEGRPVTLVSDQLYALGAGALILFLQAALSNRIALARDVDTMRELMHQQQVQYDNSRENIQLINEKYHDLKQMLRTLQGKLPPQTLQRLDEQVSEYDTAVRTGNEVLDVLLTEKRMLCDKHHIRITSLVGGVDLSFVEDLDLYTLFSNALSNAIEAVSRLPEAEERFIALSISRAGGAVVIHMENPCTGVLHFVDGLPQSQGDRSYHGFGMRSMERVAEKYGGTLSAVQRDGRFYLDIVLLAKSGGRLRGEKGNLRGPD